MMASEQAKKLGTDRKKRSRAVLALAAVTINGLAALAAALLLGSCTFESQQPRQAATIALAPASFTAPVAAPEPKPEPIDFLPERPVFSDAVPEPLASDAPPPSIGIKLPETIAAIDTRQPDLPPAATPRGGTKNRPILFPNINEAAILAEDAKIPREVLPTGPTAKMSLFGVSAEGRSFVFVIDRSASMGGGGLGAIAAASKELEQQLATITPEQNIQVIAYNQTAVAVGDGELFPTDEAKRKHIVRWVADLAAFGQTEHIRGLIMALKLKPEVIFLLTDGGDRRLRGDELRIVRDEATPRTVIHAIHFGRGSPNEGQEFLRRLAGENRGQYVFIDTNN